MFNLKFSLILAISVSRCAATFQCEFAKLDYVSIINIHVGLRCSVLGDDTLAVWKILFQTTSSGHVISVHVRVDCKQEKSYKVYSVQNVRTHQHTDNCMLLWLPASQRNLVFRRCCHEDIEDAPCLVASIQWKFSKLMYTVLLDVHVYISLTRTLLRTWPAAHINYICSPKFKDAWSYFQLSHLL